MVITRSCTFVLTSVLCFTACDRTSPVERRLIGTWEQSTIEGPVRTTFQHDHTWLMGGGVGDGVGPSHGHWRIEGGDLVMTVDWPNRPAYKDSQRNWRVPLSSFIEGQKKQKAVADLILVR